MWPDCSYCPIAAVVDWPQPADIVVDFVAGNDAVRPIVQAMVDRGQVERAAVDHCSIVADLVAVDIDRDIDQCCWAIHRTSVAAVHMAGMAVYLLQSQDVDEAVHSVPAADSTLAVVELVDTSQVLLEDFVSPM